MGISRSYSGAGQFSTGGDVQFVSAGWNSVSASSVVLPINTVDLSRSYLIYGFSSPSPAAGNNPLITFASAGGIRIETGGGGGGAATYGVFIYQASPGIIKSTQRVVTSAASATISAVTPAKAMVIGTGVLGTGAGASLVSKFDLTSSTNVNISGNIAGLNVGFQVVEFN